MLESKRTFDRLRAAWLLHTHAKCIPTRCRIVGKLRWRGPLLARSEGAITRIRLTKVLQVYKQHEAGEPIAIPRAALAVQVRKSVLTFNRFRSARLLDIFAHHIPTLHGVQRDLRGRGPVAAWHEGSITRIRLRDKGNSGRITRYDEALGGEEKERRETA